MLIIIIPKTKQDIFNCYGLPTGTIFKVLITIFILPRTQWVVEITLYLDHEQVCDLFKFHLTTKVRRWWVSEWLLFNANSAILSAMHHGENKLIFNETTFVLEYEVQLGSAVLTHWHAGQLPGDSMPIYTCYVRHVF